MQSKGHSSETEVIHMTIELTKKIYLVMQLVWSLNEKSALIIRFSFLMTFQIPS